MKLTAWTLLAVLAVLGPAASGRAGSVTCTEISTGPRQWVSTPLVTAQGDVCYRVCESYASEIRVYRDGVNQDVARTGQAAPGVSLSGATLATLSDPFIAQGGRVCFHGTFDWDGGTAVDAVWAEAPSGVSLVAMEGMAVPGQPGMTFRDLWGPRMGPAGEVAFGASYRESAGSGSVDRDGYYSWRQGQGLAALLVEGQPAPGVQDANVHLLKTLYATDEGFVLSASMDLGACTYRDGIWTRGAGATAVLAHTPYAAPWGTEWSFGVDLAGPNADVVVDMLDEYAVVASGACRKLAALNDPLPGPNDLSFRSMQQFPCVNAAGRGAFAAKALPQSSPFQVGGVWAEDANGDGKLLALEGQQAPGLPAGAMFSGVFDDVVIGETGQVAFTAWVSSIPGECLFATDPDGTLHLVAGEGLDLPGVGTVAELVFAANGNVVPELHNLTLAFSPNSELVFGAEILGQGDRVFVAVVPEPSAGVLLAVTSCALLRRRRQRAASTG
jgi:hypothetical protein